MSDAAQGEPPKHKVFQQPFKVTPAFEQWNTPGIYRTYPGGDTLPPKLNVWRIQKTGQDFGGVVSISYGYEDSPDTEILTPGFNVGKNSGAVGVGRHGNFLQWGFSAPPSQMTDAGKAFFLNCVCYIHEYDRVRPLIRTERMARSYSLVLGVLIAKVSDKDFASEVFGQELAKRFANDADGLVGYLKDGYELIYNESSYAVDQDLKALGIPSNRRLATLERLIELLSDPAKAATAQKLLNRYTEQQFQKQEEWRAWLTANRSRIYFTDVGGYKFKVIPEGYPAMPGRLASDPPRDEP